jgi:hypothetical protein
MLPVQGKRKPNQPGPCPRLWVSLVEVRFYNPRFINRVVGVQGQNFPQRDKQFPGVFQTFKVFVNKEAVAAVVFDSVGCRDQTKAA